MFNNDERRLKWGEKKINMWKGMNFVGLTLKRWQIIFLNYCGAHAKTFFHLYEEKCEVSFCVASYSSFFCHGNNGSNMQVFGTIIFSAREPAPNEQS